MKLHKSYKKMSKKELLKHLSNQMSQNIEIVSENTNLCQEIYLLNKSKENLELFLTQSEKALEYKEKVIEKYKYLLEQSVETA